MSLRTAFLLLLFANLAFFGWAALIDVPPEPAHSDSISNLPQLKLLSEVRGKASSPAPAPAAAAGPSASSPGAPVAPVAPVAAGSGASGTSTSAASTSASAASGSAGAAASAGSTGSVGSGGSAASQSAGAAPPGALSAGAALLGPASADAGRRCVTIGPFADPERAREAADLLRARAFAPRGRTAASRPPQGYWVFIGGLKSPADEASVLHRLESNGISDAKAMPASDAGRRISVGLFNALDGAERRARAVRRLGLDPQVESRPGEQAHWVDVDLDSSSQSLPAEGLLSLEEPGSRLEIKECPASKGGTAAGAFTAADHPRPGGDAGRAVR